MNGYFGVYWEGRERIVGLVRGCSAEQLERMVPGCPDWTVTDTVAHLAAVATEVVTGALTGAPDDEHTAAQVAQRRGRTLEELIAEWDEACGKLAGWGSSEGPIEQALATRRLPAAMVHDVLTHEADIRGALGAGRPPDSAWAASLAIMLRYPERLGKRGRLTVLAGPDEFTVGSGEPAATLEVDPYEFWRAQVGRRSRAQMAAWRWSGDPEPYLQAIPVFGPTATDLTEPVSPLRCQGTDGRSA